MITPPKDAITEAAFNISLSIFSGNTKDNILFSLVLTLKNGTGKEDKSLAICNFCLVKDNTVCEEMLSHNVVLTGFSQ